MEEHLCGMERKAVAQSMETGKWVIDDYVKEDVTELYESHYSDLSANRTWYYGDRCELYQRECWEIYVNVTNTDEGNVQIHHIHHIIPEAFGALRYVCYCFRDEMAIAFLRPQWNVLLQSLGSFSQFCQ
jgi:hypothetical protein